MRLVGPRDYENFRSAHNFVYINGLKVELIPRQSDIIATGPNQFQMQEYTVWSFPSRGHWATHRGNYRGNWSPYVPRNLILKYTGPGDVVLDPFCGSGTTLVEAKLLERNAVGVDINPDAIMVSRNRLDFSNSNKCRIDTYVGDARKLDLVTDNSVDLIATHPPYSGIIAYSGRRSGDLVGDLSNLSLSQYISQMKVVAKECFRVLKFGKHCAVLIGDTRKRRHYVPISVLVLSSFLKAGFLLKEDIIKVQHKTKVTREKWRSHNYDFYKIAHEHLYVFRKPLSNEKLSQFRFSNTINLDGEGSTPASRSPLPPK